jgi:hypothetical protein
MHSAYIAEDGSVNADSHKAAITVDRENEENNLAEN